MTKADFLQLLERALAQLPEEERRANLEYYSELLDDMLEEGMTEAEATAKLGSPSQIAQSILQEVPLGKLVSTRMKPKSGWTPLAIVLAVVGSPVWVPLLLLAAALVLSLFGSIWGAGRGGGGRCGRPCGGGGGRAHPRYPGRCSDAAAGSAAAGRRTGAAGSVCAGRTDGGGAVQAAVAADGVAGP